MEPVGKQILDKILECFEEDNSMFVVQSIF